MSAEDFILAIYKDSRTVFGLADVAMLFPQADGKTLSERLRYYVRTGRLESPRRGIYAKPDYNRLELANALYKPSYISLEYVLQQAGVVFQFDSRITSVSYLSREVLAGGKTFSYRRIKEQIIIDPTGVTRRENVNMATPERAFLDILYLNKEFYFDNLHPIDKGLIEKILPIYRSSALEKRVAKLLK